VADVSALCKQPMSDGSAVVLCTGYCHIFRIFKHGVYVYAYKRKEIKLKNYGWIIPLSKGKMVAVMLQA